MTAGILLAPVANPTWMSDSDVLRYAGRSWPQFRSALIGLGLVPQDTSLPDGTLEEILRPYRDGGEWPDGYDYYNDENYGGGGESNGLPPAGEELPPHDGGASGRLKPHRFTRKSLFPTNDMYIEQSAYNSLEISKITALISRRCRSELGALVAENIAPAADLSELTKRRELFEDVEKYRGRKGELPWTDGLVSVAFMLEFAEENGLLSGEELVKIRLMLTLAGRMRETLTEARDEYPAFSILLRSMRDFARRDGNALGHRRRGTSLRLRLGEARRGAPRDARPEGYRCAARATRCWATRASPRCSTERVLTLRNGRHAFLVRQDAISQFPGAVIERSGSGNSVYMEPHSLMSLNNEYSKLYGEEMLEETRIFREFTARLIKRKKGILDTENVLGTVDLFYALSETARPRQVAYAPTSRSARSSPSVRARHPLLGAKSVPIDFKCAINSVFSS